MRRVIRAITISAFYCLMPVIATITLIYSVVVGSIFGALLSAYFRRG